MLAVGAGVNTGKMDRLAVLAGQVGAVRVEQTVVPLQLAELPILEVVVAVGVVYRQWLIMLVAPVAPA